MQRPKWLPAHIHWNTDEEEAAIQRGIDADPDNPELTDEFFARARPASEVCPEIVAAYLRNGRRLPAEADPAPAQPVDKVIEDGGG